MADNKKSLFELAKEADKASKKEQKAGQQKASPEAPAKTVRDIGVIEDIAKGLGSGVGRGLFGIAGLGGDIQTISRLAKRAEQAGAKKFTEEQLANLPAGAASAIRRTAQEAPVDITAPTVLPTSQQVYSGLERVLPEGTLTYKPQTAGGRIAQMAGEFGSAGALGRAPVRGALMYGGIGAGAGGISEVSPTAGAVAGIASGIGAGTLASRRRGVESLLGDVVGEQTPAMLARAEQLQEQGRAIGVPLTAAESMESPSLRTLASSVAARPESAGIISQKILERTEGIKPAIERGLLGIEEVPTGLAGTVQREAVKAAGGAVRRIEGVRTGKTTNLYEDAKLDSLDASQITPIITAARNAKKTVDPTVANAIDDFISRISSMKTVNKKRVRVPETNVGKLESSYRVIRDLISSKARKEGRAPDVETAAELRKLNKMLDEALLSNENIAEARAIFKEATPEVVRAVDDTGIRAISKLEPDAEDTAISLIIGGKPTPEKVGAVVKELNIQDKTVVPKIARRWMENAQQDAMKITTQGKVPLSAGVKFVRSVRGTKDSKQHASMNKLIEGVANAKGVDPVAMKNGFNNMLDVLERTNLIDAFGSPTSTRQATEKAMEDITGFLPKALQTELTAPTRQVGKALQSRGVNRAYKQIAEAMVADDAVNAIMRLALLDPKSRQAQNLVANIINPVRETGQAIENVYTAPTGEQYGITGGGTTASLLGE